MERNVVSLDTARKLKAAGFPQNSVYEWYTGGPGGKYLVAGKEPGVYHQVKYFAAPTAQEIADQLPPQTSLVHSDLSLRKRSGFGGYEASWRSAGMSETASTMAEALAALYLKLKEARSDG